MNVVKQAALRDGRPRPGWLVSRDDAIRVLRHVIRIQQLDPLGVRLADMSGNGRVTAFDAARILVAAARR